MQSNNFLEQEAKLFIFGLSILLQKERKVCLVSGIGIYIGFKSPPPPPRLLPAYHSPLSMYGSKGLDLTSRVQPQYELLVMIRSRNAMSLRICMDPDSHVMISLCKHFASKLQFMASITFPNTV